MQPKIYTVEELMLNDSFLNYCLNKEYADKVFWDKEINLYNDQQKIFAEAKYTILLLHGKLDENDVARQVEKVKNLVERHAGKYSSHEKLMEPLPANRLTEKYKIGRPVKNISKAFWALGLAACLFIIFGINFSTHTYSKSDLPRPPIIQSSYVSKIGERRTIQLPDGSVAILNSNSTITLGEDFNRAERNIQLTGEAFFSVAKDAAKPFIVHSGVFSVTAVGTAFYVYARNIKDDYKVDLLEGKVTLETTEAKPITSGIKTVLLPGEKGTWQSSKASFNKSLCDSALLRKWLNGRLSFKEMPVENVLELLQKWYGVTVIINHKKWEHLTLTGDYDNKPLDHVLKIICFSLSARYSYSGNKVIIE
jgi:transmembrane sensor